MDPGQLGAATNAQGVPPHLWVIGPGRRQSNTYPLMYSVTDLGS